jgi:hypothetical protein
MSLLSFSDFWILTIGVLIKTIDIVSDRSNLSDVEPGIDRLEELSMKPYKPARCKINTNIKRSVFDLVCERKSMV